MLPAMIAIAGGGGRRPERSTRLPQMMRIDLHTHIVPERWEDFAARYGGGK
jgi:hypothetical protein